MVTGIYKSSNACRTPKGRCASRGVLLSVIHVMPNRSLPDEFTTMLQHEVEKNGVQLVVIDSLNG